MKHLRSSLGYCLFATSILVPTGVLAKVYADLDASVGGTADTDPFLQGGSSTSAAAVSATLRPVVRIEDERLNLRLGGLAGVDHYFEKYGTEETYAANLDADYRLSPVTSARLYGSLLSTRNQLRRPRFDSLGNPPSANPDLSLDPTQVGRSQRFLNTSFGAGIDSRISATDTISVDGYYQSSDTKGSGTDYSSLSASGGYSKKFDERTTGSASVTYTDIDFAGGRVADGQIINGMLEAERSVSSSGTLTLGLGASRTERWISPDEKKTVTHLSARASYCNRLELSTLCLTAERAARPTSFDGITTVTTVDLAYNRRLGKDDTFTVIGQYGRSNSNSDTINGPGFRSEIAGGSVNFEHKINPATAFSITARGERRFDSPQQDGATNVGISAGLSVHFGARR